MSLGPAEVLVILVVALIVFGPKRLPEVGRQVGGAMRELRKMQDTVRDELSSVMHDEPRYDDHHDDSTMHAVEPDADHDDASGEGHVVSHLDDSDNGPTGSFS
jgi:Tat protein translocase TatB subunit